MLLIRPKVSHVGWFSFGHTEELLEIGYTAAREALKGLPALLRAPGGIFPRRSVAITVDRDACTGCGLCVARAPHMMALDVDRKAYPLSSRQEWSPADGAFVQACPVGAIHVR